jgi:hypothetical protein
VGITLSPHRSARINVYVQRWTGSAWKPQVGQNFTLPTGGSMTITFPGWERKVRYRAKAVFGGDIKNNPAKPAYSRPFMID